MTAKSAVTKNTLINPDDAPELTDNWFEKADLMQGVMLVPNYSLLFYRRIS
jgi:hypothetical protein